ncbi:MAG: hypothetical protein AAFX40_12760, partial [Cyanobacteria bacterium J06639_1]
MAASSSRISMLISKYLLATVGSSRSSRRGFVLPVAVLITLVLALVAATVTTRSLNRGQQSTGVRNQQIVNNEVKQALDRARSKLDYLFGTGTQAGGRLPQGRPATDYLTSLLLDGTTVNSVTAPPPVAGQSLSFQLTDENPLTLSPSIPSAAWWFDVDSDNDGVADAVTAYTILMNTTNPSGTLRVEQGLVDSVKADNLIVRDVAISSVGSSAGCASAIGAGLPLDAAGNWFRGPSGQFVKPIQVVAVTLPKSSTSGNQRAVAAVQLQEDRFRSTLAEFGAYFRSDLEIFPGPSFNWNGKVYSEGNIFIGSNAGATDRFEAYLISDRDSCYFNPSERSTLGSPFEIVAGTITKNDFVGGGEIHIQDGTDSPPIITFNKDNDSVNASNFGNLAIDPSTLYTQAAHVPKYVVNGEPLGKYRDSAWETSPLADGGTLGEARVTLLDPDVDILPTPPYVDDSYRADDRCGPRPNYGQPTLPGGCNVNGDTINASETEIVAESPIGGDKDAVGLDGYWERRARNEGTRIIVGQRISLLRGHPLNPDVPEAVDQNGDGALSVNEARNAFPTNATNMPTTTVDTDNSDQIDRLEQAVQATAVYHHTSSNDDVPIACLSTMSNANAESPVLDQREFVPPNVTSFANLNTPMMRALVNLANLSSDGDDRDASTNGAGGLGDVNLGTIGNGSFDPVAGAFPPFQETNSSSDKTHPNPTLIPYGDFSNLRRVLELVDGGETFNTLSIADRSYLYTSACAITMLATASVDTGSGNNAFGNPALAGDNNIHGSSITEPLFQFNLDLLNALDGNDDDFDSDGNPVDNTAADVALLAGAD